MPKTRDYRVKITGTDSGSMNITMNEFDGIQNRRTVEFYDVPLTENCEYTTSIKEEFLAPVSDYNLISDNGEIVESDFDSLPSVESNIVDVIVAEELFEGFSTELIDKMADAMFNMRSSVDISSYLITVEDIMGLFSAVQKYYPSEYSIMSKTDFSYKALVSPSQGIVTGFRFYYDADVSLSVYQKRVRDLQEEINKLVAKTEGMNDFEKALFVHDYIVLHCEYDYDLCEMIETQGRLDGEVRSERYTEYSVLVNGTGVCGSYALAYRAVLNAAGVECLYLSSAEMNHAWNLVKIDGNWYHCDLTWDDTGYGNDYHYGIAERTYFLHTDEEIMQLNHRSWTPGQYKATSTAFSDMPRYDDYRQKYDNGKWYYLFGGSIYSSDIYGENKEEIVEASASALEVADGEIYYSTGRNILHYDNDAHKSNYVYVLPKAKCGDEASKASIRNFYINDENVTIYIKGVFNGNNTTTKFYDALNEEKYSEITGLTISQSELTLNVFDTHQLSVQILSRATTVDLDISWSTSNPSVVMVDQNGLLKGRNVGEATVSANCLDFTASCYVTVDGNGLSGMCGESVRWEYDTNSKTLFFSGSGNMDYHAEYDYSIRQEVVRAVVNDGVESLSDMCFNGCSELESVSMGNTLKTIGQAAFSYCPRLTELIFPDSVEYIGSSAFSSSDNLQRVFLGALANIDENNTFNGTAGLQEIRVSENNELYQSVDGVLFSKNSERLIKYPSGKKATTYIIPQGTKIIGCNAFCENKNLIEVTLADTVEILESYAFYISNIERFHLNEGLIRIENCAFASTKIEEIDIPKTVSFIDPNAFILCQYLEKIFVDKGNNYFESDLEGCLYSSNHEKLVSYPVAKKNASYRIPDGTKYIMHDAFNGNKFIETVIFPNTVTSISSLAFANCSNLKQLSIPSSVTSISSGAFSGCYSLDSITVPSSTRVSSASYNGYYAPFYGVLNVNYYGSDTNAPWGGESIKWIYRRWNGISR